MKSAVGRGIPIYLRGVLSALAQAQRSPRLVECLGLCFSPLGFSVPAFVLWVWVWWG